MMNLDHPFCGYIANTGNGLNKTETVLLFLIKIRRHMSGGYSLFLSCYYWNVPPHIYILLRPISLSSLPFPRMGKSNVSLYKVVVFVYPTLCT